MRPKFLLAVVGGLLAVGAVPLRGEEKGKDSPYYPLAIGMQWHYRLGDDKVHIRAAKQEKVGETLCYLLESVKNGEVIETEHVAFHADGLYRHAMDGIALEPPMCVLKLPPRKGDTWKVSFKSGEASVKGTWTVDAREVEVPAGKFKTMVAESSDFEIEGVKVSLACWFAPGVGIVKKSAKIGKLELDLELEKFGMPK